MLACMGLFQTGKVGPVRYGWGMLSADTSPVQYYQEAAVEPWSWYSIPTPAHTSQSPSEETRDKDLKNLKLSLISPFAYHIFASDRQIPSHRSLNTAV